MSGQRGGWSPSLSTGNFMANPPKVVSGLRENFEIGRRTADLAMTGTPRGHDLRNFNRSQRQHARVK